MIPVQPWEITTNNFLNLIIVLKPGNSMYWTSKSKFYLITQNCDLDTLTSLIWCLAIFGI